MRKHKIGKWVLSIPVIWIGTVPVLWIETVPDYRRKINTDSLTWGEEA
jgi:hypothetical protein